MSTDSLVMLFLGAFISWVVLGLLYSFHVEERKPEPPTVRIVTRGHIRVKVVPLAYRPPSRMPLDVAPFNAEYQGYYEALLHALEKERNR